MKQITVIDSSGDIKNKLPKEYRNMKVRFFQHSLTMNRTKKQTRQNNRLVTIISLIVALVAVVYAINTHRAAQLASYAATNNCTWSYNGTAYGDNRDYTCK
nr:MAG TPA: hypothetical protein [Caudoviricetes sp.]